MRCWKGFKVPGLRAMPRRTGDFSHRRHGRLHQQESWRIAAEGPLAE
jgi:hypothetical protein